MRPRAGSVALSDGTVTERRFPGRPALTATDLDACEPRRGQGVGSSPVAPVETDVQVRGPTPRRPRSPVIVSSEMAQMISAVIRAQPDLRLTEPTIEPAAEIVRSALSGVAVWWIDHPEVRRPLLVDLATGMVQGQLRTGPS